MTTNQSTDARLHLETEGGTLERGQSIRMICPFCGGGRSKETSLSLTHTEDGALLFICYRGKCGVSGKVGGPRLVHTRVAPTKHAKQPKEPLSPRLVPLPDDVATIIADHWYIRHSLWQWDPSTERIAMQVFGPLGNLRGYILRALPNDRNKQPKVLTWKETFEPWCHWELRATDRAYRERPLLVVEDIPSALRVGAYAPSVALVGCHVTDDVAQELIGRVDDIVWALDRDAFNRAVEWSTKYRLFFRRSRVWCPDRDFKNMTEVEIAECLSNIL